MAAYDPDRPLVIDLVLSYATYLGGSRSDCGLGIAVDATGAAYVVGGTGSPDFPTTPGAFQATLGGGGSIGQLLPSDAFVAKLATPLFECLEDRVEEFRDCVNSCPVGDCACISACILRFRACIDGCLP